MDRWHLAGSHPSNYESGIDPQITSHAKNCAYLKCLVEEPEGFATLVQSFKAAAYRHKRMRFAAVVKIDQW